MKQCFVIMPIGSEEDYEKYKDIYECMIKEAVTGAGLELQCIRADEVSKSGAIIKDVIKRLYEADVVIADLSGLNPNVCYELGVRHALKGGTIMIVDDIESIPFDLKPYRVLEYSTTLRGVYEFGQKLKAFLEAALGDPRGADNPVLDFLPRPERERVEQVEAIHNRQLIDELRSELAEKTELLADEIDSLRQDRAHYTPPPAEVCGEVSPEVRKVIETLTERIEKLEKPAAVAVEKVPEVKVEKTAEQWVQDGNAGLALGNYQEVLEMYSKAIGLDPKNATAYCGRGAVYWKLGEPSKAISEFNKAIKLKNALAYIGRGMLYEELDEFEKAIGDYSKAIKLNPKYAWAYHSRGRAYYKTGQLGKAGADYNKAIKLNPKYASAYDNLAYVLYDLDQVEEAVEHWEKAVELESNADHHAGLGLGLWKTGEKERAVQEYRKALELESRFDDTEWMKSEHLWSDKAMVDVRPLIEEAKKEKP
jgi:tetratricopeptide (TPR) repeat protein